MVKGGLVLLILSIFLISFVYADRVTMSPITGRDIVSSTADQPGVSITEGNNPNPAGSQSNSQNFIKNNLIYLMGGIILIIIIVLLAILIKKIKKR